MPEQAPGAKMAGDPVEASPGGEVSDAELIARCVAGDQRAWRQLVVRYERLVYSVPRRLRLPDELVEDAFQETFLILLRQLPRIERHEALPKWLTTTTRRVALRLATRQRQQQQHPLPAALESVDDAALERLELTHQVQGALDELGGRCRDLLIALVRAERTPYAIVARELQMPVGSIGPTRARCLARLLELLKAKGVEP